ncbi:hypothetical protein [Streptomyces sp. P17]|uniref:hypothetical protein n=1 Tax=Streptomyces sp. P17 TaxID=3074716 RepID=UPI0028F44E00|nr:hypothetical protein [Streptomyces sp. P17]MDT9698949.1 hypothetical protein [Streptomyces sp. P17]
MAGNGPHNRPPRIFAVREAEDGGGGKRPAQPAPAHLRLEAVVDHSGATGKQVTLRAELTDAKGNSVSQTVIRAYDVR